MDQALSAAESCRLFAEDATISLDKAPDVPTITALFSWGLYLQFRETEGAGSDGNGRRGGQSGVQPNHVSRRGLAQGY